MKKQILCSILYRFLAVLVFAGSPWVAGAQVTPEVNQSDSLALNEPVIRYLGADDSFYYLQVQLDNPAMDRIHIVLKDKLTDALVFETSFTERYFLQTVPVPHTSRCLQWLLNCRPKKNRELELLAIW